MPQMPIRNWWLLAAGGVFEAVYAAMNLFGQDVVFLGKPALAAGVCTVAAAIGKPGRGGSWLLALNGLALSAFGVASLFPPHGRVGFLPYALLFVIMAMSIGILALSAARGLRQHVSEQWFFGLAGAVLVGFALGFLIFGFRWIRLEPLAYVLWMSSYFAFSAICKLGLGLRLRPGLSR